MLVASVLVVPTIILEQADVGRPWTNVALVLNYGIWLAFTIEAVVMLSVVSDKRAWGQSHPLELAIVVVTAPFLLQALQPLRALRLCGCCGC